MSPKSALVLLAEGSEEIETIVPVDVLRRAGITVTLAGVSGAGVHVCSRQVKVVPDLSLEEATTKGPYDVVILPGGFEGAKVLRESASVGEFLKKHDSEGRLIGTLCAASTALKAHSIGVGKTITTHPTDHIEQMIMDGSMYNYVRERVVVDGNIITSQGPGTAFEFVLAILKEILGNDEAVRISKSLLLQ